MFCTFVKHVLWLVHAWDRARPRPSQLHLSTTSLCFVWDLVDSAVVFVSVLLLVLLLWLFSWVFFSRSTFFCLSPLCLGAMCIPYRMSAHSSRFFVIQSSSVPSCLLVFVPSDVRLSHGFLQHTTMSRGLVPRIAPACALRRLLPLLHFSSTCRLLLFCSVFCFLFLFSVFCFVLVDFVLPHVFSLGTFLFSFVSDLYLFLLPTTYSPTLLPSTLLIFLLLSLLLSYLLTGFLLTFI